MPKPEKLHSTVLIADDDHCWRTILQSRLAERYTVLLAEDGHQATLFIKNRPVDVVITDLDMPSVDGFSLAVKAMNCLNGAQLRFIVVTGMPTDDERLAKLRDIPLIVDVLHKPVDLDVLEAVVHRATAPDFLIGDDAT